MITVITLVFLVSTNKNTEPPNTNERAGLQLNEINESIHAVECSNNKFISSNHTQKTMTYLPHNAHNKITKVLEMKKHQDILLVKEKNKHQTLCTRIFIVHFQDREKTDVGYNALVGHLFCNMIVKKSMYDLPRKNMTQKKGYNRLKTYCFRRLETHIGEKNTIEYNFNFEWRDGTSL